MKINRLFRSGYTLIEVLIAAGILVAAVAAAAALSLAITTQEEISAHSAISLNHQEQAAQLWRLGLSGAEITSLLPPNPKVQTLAFAETDLTVAGIGTVRRAVCTIGFQTTPDAGDWSPFAWTGGSQTTQPVRSNSIILIRPITP